VDALRFWDAALYPFSETGNPTFACRAHLSFAEVTPPENLSFIL